MAALLLRANGTREPLAVPPEGLSLDTLQALVGGCIELVWVVEVGPVDLQHRLVLVVDEEGLLKGKPVNGMATELYRGTPPRHDGVIVGDVILAECLDVGGDDERIV
jgi:hypothetical protein